MNKFKVGDKVKLRAEVRPTEYAYAKHDEVFKVLEIDIFGNLRLSCKEGYFYPAVHFKLVECVERQQAMTQEQLDALKASLEKLKEFLPRHWEYRHNEMWKDGPGGFFADMEVQGLLSEPKPKTAQEIAQEALSNLNERSGWVPYNPDSNESKMKAALEQIAKGEQS